MVLAAAPLNTVDELELTVDGVNRCHCAASAASCNANRSLNVKSAVDSARRPDKSGDADVVAVGVVTNAGAKVPAAQGGAVQATLEVVLVALNC